MIKRRVTQRDVARVAKVSQAAVSRVMGKHGYVADDVRERIEKAAFGLGYRPDPVARSLITGRSNIVAIIVGNIVNPFFPVVLDALTEALRSSGKEVLLFNIVQGQSLDDLILDVLNYKVNGIILTTATLESSVQDVRETLDVPIVFFHRYADSSGLPGVACDNYAGGYQAARLLLDANRRRLAYVGGNRNSSPDRDRRRGFLDGMLAAGVEPVSILDGTFTYGWGWKATIDLFQSDKSIDGLFCGDDAIAFGAMDALRYKLGLSVPRQVSVVGFDDVPQASWAAYGLTTIRQPIERMIERTIDLLEKPASAVSAIEFIPGEMVMRSTVSAAPDPISAFKENSK